MSDRRHEEHRRISAWTAVGLALCLSAAVWVAWCASEQLADNSGDAAIYWVYAKSMWSHGFFHFGSGGVKHGATSPLWALLLGAVYPFARDSFLVYKILALGFMGLASVALWRLARAARLPIVAAAGAAVFLAGSTSLQKFSACGFETPLFMALLVVAAEATFRRADAWTRAGGSLPASSRRARAGWSLLVGALPLARPEGAMFAAVFVIWLVVVSRGRFIAREWRWIGVAMLPAALFYGWMAFETGRLIPSSIEGRYARRALQDTYQPPESIRTLLNQCTGAGYLGYHSTPFVLAWNTLFAVGVATLGARRRAATSALVALPLLLWATFVWGNPGHYYTRYGLSVMPFGVLFVTIGLVKVIEYSGLLAGAFARRAWVAPFAAFALTGAMVWLPVHRLIEHTAAPRRLLPERVLDRAGSRSLNERLGADARLLVYEVQTQYDLDAPVFAADGIVGGEILPYLYEKRIDDFIRDFDITHVLVSDAFDYRSTFHETVLHELWRCERSARDSQRVVLETTDLRFVREVHEDRTRKLPHWEAVYSVKRMDEVYEDSGRSGGGDPNSPSVFR